MLGILKASGETVRRLYRDWGIGIFVLPVLVAIALVGLVLTHPTASRWISEAVEAEFASGIYEPGVAPTQVAQPPAAIRTVRAN
jgi:hypothetical protein